MLRFALLALLFVASASAGHISFTDCGSAGNVISVDVPGCSGTQRCVFRKGETYHILTHFEPSTSGATSNLEVKATVSIITVDIIKPENNNGCTGYNPNCPYTAGRPIVHTTTMTISDQFIETDATVQLRILNASNGAEVCIRAPARVTA